MTTTTQFKIDTAILTAKGNLAGYARITGSCDYDTATNEEFELCYAELHIKTVETKYGTKTSDGTNAYYIDKLLLGSLSDAIDEAIERHMQYVLYDEVKGDIEPVGVWEEQTDADRNPSLHRII